MKLYAAFMALFVVSMFSLKTEKEQRKIITDGEYKYTFFVTIDKKSTHKITKKYFWYKSGKVHSSVGGSNGDLLHGLYTKSGAENEILEQGHFKHGLKDGYWKDWYQDGKLKTLTKWKMGLKSGVSIVYKDDGSIHTKGEYKKNKKHGIWLNEETKDTLFFKEGLKIDNPDRKTFKKSVKNFFKKVFPKKEDQENRKKEKRAKKTNRTKKDKSNG